MLIQRRADARLLLFRSGLLLLRCDVGVAGGVDFRLEPALDGLQALKPDLRRRKTPFSRMLLGLPDRGVLLDKGRTQASYRLRDLSVASHSVADVLGE